MTKFWKCLLSLAVAAFLIAPAFAEDAKPKKNRPTATRKEQPAVQLPKEITLTDEQKTKVAEVEKEYAPKMKERERWQEGQRAGSGDQGGNEVVRRTAKALRRDQQTNRHSASRDSG